MIEEIETLAAVARYRTMNRAAVYLRISQSAVSKRVASLQARLGYELTKQQGRNIVLTQEGIDYLALAAPLVSELKSLGKQVRGYPGTRFLKVGISESLASEKFLKVLMTTGKDFGLELSLHCHRSPMIYDLVASGQYELGICVRDPSYQNKSLFEDHLFTESMVLAEAKKKQTNPRPLWFIEASSHSQRQLNSKLKTASLMSDHQLESFAVLAQCTKAGLCRAVLPQLLAESIGSSSLVLRELRPKLSRDIVCVYRKRLVKNEFLMSLKYKLGSGDTHRSA